MHQGHSEANWILTAYKPQVALMAINHKVKLDLGGYDSAWKAQSGRSAYKSDPITVILRMTGLTAKEIRDLVIGRGNIHGGAGSQSDQLP